MNEGVLSISINDKGIGSFPPQREEIKKLSETQIEMDRAQPQIHQRKQSPLKELHDVISHNIDERAEEQNDEGKNKFNECEEEASMEQVFNNVVKEADISPRSKQQIYKKGKKQVNTDTLPVRVVPRRGSLMEPFQHYRQIQAYRRILGMTYAHYNCNGKVWFFVQDHVDVEILQDQEQQITIKLFFQEWDKSLMVSMVYAKCDHLERMSLWDSLYGLADQMEIPWLVGGDFNVIMHEDEKIGGLPVFPIEYEDFAFCINSCELYEINYKGSLFTWWNGRTGSDSWITDFEGDEFIKFKLKLKNVKPVLTVWSKATFGDIFKQLTVREEVVKIKEQCFEENPTPVNRMFSQQLPALDYQMLHQVPHMVDQDTNDQLIRISTLQEVKKAVFALAAESAAGPDGMSGIFYQTCWDIVGVSVHNLVKAFFHGQTLPKAVTHTNLVLIPKKNNIETFADMRPISLSNFINKVISRVVQEKLEGILPSLISPNQSGFVRGRSIIENVLLT
ncbi:uncharacterized protein LOC129884128 [Solanum dulcamara]|uniref:uncharacterized protein LOC129884128 n=1 Tax=Solanum dulcamara TaxID=45834 RepID=UPI0024861215|nr:uncharacterized protein LOC129884128 [Solanum dulcamara]